MMCVYGLIWYYILHCLLFTIFSMSRFYDILFFVCFFFRKWVFLFLGDIILSGLLSNDNIAYSLLLLHKRGPTVLMMPWASWIVGAERLVPYLSALLLIMLYVGVQCGLVARKAKRATAHNHDVVAIDRFAPAVADTAFRGHGADPSDVACPNSTRAEKACTCDWSDLCKHTMHVRSVEFAK